MTGRTLLEPERVAGAEFVPSTGIKCAKPYRLPYRLEASAGSAWRTILTPEFPRGSQADCPQPLHRCPQVSHRSMCECLHKQTQYEGSTGSAAKRPPDCSRGRETPHEQDQHHSPEPGSDRNGDQLICLKPVGPNGNAVVIDNKVADEQLLLIAE